MNQPDFFDELEAPPKPEAGPLYFVLRWEGDTLVSQLSWPLQPCRFASWPAAFNGPFHPLNSCPVHIR